ncbi:hypothetical protein EVAR_85157_1 [Eumeta japonica]|uniref:DDE Tnp4 domain-containing protein n=1 Tax=Eumeta variegata TaxID=151549 RepID=A0A4C1XUL4_EUMVA|nr:hypothetical protein EVAR_85157_1 [Eumeta japonica]
MLTIHRNRTKQTMDNQLAEMLAEPSGEFDNFDTDWREAIPVKIRLALTLRYLATGDSFRSLHYLFKVSSQLISRIVPEVCLALNEALKDFVKGKIRLLWYTDDRKFFFWGRIRTGGEIRRRNNGLRMIPTTTEEWLSKAERFKFPHCLGAMDGKHVTILPPPHSGTEYYNYKHSFSIVLLAIVDYDYCFMFAEIGAQGRISDGGVFNQSSISKISENSINLPPPSSLPGSMPFHPVKCSIITMTCVLIHNFYGKAEHLATYTHLRWVPPSLALPPLMCGRKTDTAAIPPPSYAPQASLRHYALYGGPLRWTIMMAHHVEEPLAYEGFSVAGINTSSYHSVNKAAVIQALG